MKENYNELESYIEQSLLNWYAFSAGSRILLLPGCSLAIRDYFSKLNCNLYFAEEKDLTSGCFREKYRDYFDYIISICDIEKTAYSGHLINTLHDVINDNGILFLAANNRLSISNFCGNRDFYTSRVFDGLNDYMFVNPYNKEINRGKCLSKRQIVELIEQGRLNISNCFSVMSRLKHPQLLISDKYKPTESLSIRYTPTYDSNDTIFMEEEYICNSLIDNDLFHGMANSFLFVCSKNQMELPIRQITLSMDRGKENAIATIVYDNYVEKKALFEEGKTRLKLLSDNTEKLEAAGIDVVKGALVSDVYQMEKIEGELANVYLQHLLRKDKQQFIDAVDKFRECILSSSEHVWENDEDGAILKDAYLDMVPLNAFVKDGHYKFFDQEYVSENYPANAIIFRSIAIIYELDSKLEGILPQSFFWRRYNLEKNGNKLFSKLS